MFETITYTIENQVAWIRLNRPDKLNAFTEQMNREIQKAIKQSNTDPTVRSIVITGEGRAFSSGQDLAEVDENMDHGEVLRTRYGPMMKELARCEKPVIAAVAGFALGGGCELALACDIRIAAENAVFGLPEIKLGVIPGGGGTQRLPRLIGVGRAKELLYTGDSINAQEAYRIGLANKVVPLDSLMDEARKLALKLVKQPAFALKMNKLAVNEGINMDLSSALGHESRCFEILFSTEDRKEGMQAFVEKREPNFKGE